MKKIQYSIYKQETGSAGGKAKNDCFDILCECGYKPSYHVSAQRIFRVIKQYLSIKNFHGDNILLVQYPTVSPQLMPFLLQKLDKIENTIAIIHDVPALQGMGGDISKQIDELNHFRYLIVHNDYMKKKLKENGCQAAMVSLQAFDYLHDINYPLQVNDYCGKIVVAGNLDKSRYLTELEQIKRYKFNLYGIKKVINFEGMSNVRYMGLLPSDKIQYFLQGNYGLVWDGNSIDTCSDIYGEYLRINNPHKMSLYMAAGIPVITWREAAIADFVRDNGVGIVVDSLKELNNIDLASGYEVMRKNVFAVKRKLAAGEFLKNAIKNVELMIENHV